MLDRLRICSLNCQGLSGYNKRKDVLNYIKTKAFDIVLIQDTHFEERSENRIRSKWGYQCWFNSHNTRPRGVAILFNNTFEYKDIQITKDNTGNYIILQGSFIYHLLTIRCHICAMKIPVGNTRHAMVRANIGFDVTLILLTEHFFYVKFRREY